MKFLFFSWRNIPLEQSLIFSRPRIEHVTLSMIMLNTCVLTASTIRAPPDEALYELVFSLAEFLEAYLEEFLKVSLEVLLMESSENLGVEFLENFLEKSLKECLMYVSLEEFLRKSAGIIPGKSKSWYLALRISVRNQREALQEFLEQSLEQLIEKTLEDSEEEFLVESVEELLEKSLVSTS